jgi:sterol 14-demethylase
MLALLFSTLLFSETIRTVLENVFAWCTTFFVAHPYLSIIFIVLFISAIKCIQYYYSTTPNAPPVYFCGLPLVGPFLSFAKDQLGTVRRARAATKSDVFTIKPLGTFLIGAEAHKAFFESFDEELDQAPVYKFMIPIFGKGVVYDAPIKKRRQQYRVLGSSLRPGLLKKYPEIIAKECHQFFKNHLGTDPLIGESVDILHKFADLTILTASATLHGREVRENLFEDVSRLFAKMDAGLTPLSVIAPYLPTPAHRARDVAHREMIALFSKVINARRASGKAPEGSIDMLQKLIDAEYKEGGKLPASEIAGLLIAALFAGQHTSSITSSWTLMFLLEDRRKGGKWYERVMQEIRLFENKYGTGMGAFARAEPSVVKEVFDMDVLYACVKEAVRMYPPLMFLMRQVCSKPLNVCGYDIPIGSRVWVSTAVSQRLPEVFKNPDTYDPGRWLGEGENGFDITSLPPYSYIGFGAGIHTCMGESFAFMQIRTILSVLLSTYEVEMNGPFPQADYDAMVVMPKGKNMITFKPRANVLVSSIVSTKSSKSSVSSSSKNDTRNTANAHVSPTILNEEATNNQQTVSDKQKSDLVQDSKNAFSSTTIQTFTMAEVAKHNKKDDLWIAVKVDGKLGVYEVTNYLPLHQGGDALLKWGGKDATDAVSGPQHPATVWSLLSRYKIGEVQDEVTNEVLSWDDLSSLL